MILQEQSAPTLSALPSLRGTSWALLRYTVDGITASLSPDMRTTLTVDADDELLVTSGMVQCAGRVSVAGDIVDLGQTDITQRPGALAGTLEDRIVRGCSGQFQAAMHGSVLRLRRAAVTMDFVPQG